MDFLKNKVTITSLDRLQTGLITNSTNDTKYYAGESKAMNGDLKERLRRIALHLMMLAERNNIPLKPFIQALYDERAKRSLDSAHSIRRKPGPSLSIRTTTTGTALDAENAEMQSILLQEGII